MASSVSHFAFHLKGFLDAYLFFLSLFLFLNKHSGVLAFRRGPFVVLTLRLIDNHP